jgi:hypothetical protein
MTLGYITPGFAIDASPLPVFLASLLIAYNHRDALLLAYADRCRSAARLRTAIRAAASNGSEVPASTSARHGSYGT